MDGIGLKSKTKLKPSERKGKYNWYYSQSVSTHLLLEDLSITLAQSWVKNLVPYGSPIQIVFTFWLPCLMNIQSYNSFASSPHIYDHCGILWSGDWYLDVLQLVHIYDHYMSCSHVIAIWMLNNWLPSSRINGEHRTKIAGLWSLFCRLFFVVAQNFNWKTVWL